MKIFYFCFLILLIASCNQDEGPEQVLRSYISIRFQEKQNFDDLLSKTTGELKANLKSLSGEDRIKFDQSSQFKKNALKILSKDCSEKKCDITYIISYEKKNQDNPYRAEIRNIAKLVNEDGDWRISSVGGLKSYFGSKKEIAP
jgi:hypothetical protein